MTPPSFNHFHHIAIIFQLFAIKTDGDFTSNEKISIKKLLGEWVGDETETNKILVESSKFLAEYDKKHSDQITDLLNYSSQCILDAGIFSESNLTSILADLQDIAISNDGEVVDNKEAFINYIAELWGIQL